MKEYRLKAGDRICGFIVKGTEELPEIDAVMVRMEYEKNGADLIWLDRDEENQTFAICFKTIPRDDTGVFHILEHSVLCGSEKYPLKEPFVELIKSSMATFLNALTFPDKTMYPVSSRNGQDFLNLIDVYLDAVLHPLSVSDPHAFRQEGWHYELDSPEGELTCNGVVYNEMKGAFASPDSVLVSRLNALLFPDTCYGYESGGHPDHIPELTYENYLESHRRYYHPSNSRIILDGRVDLETVLGRIDSYLKDYDRLEPDADIPFQQAVSPTPEVTCYEIGEEEDETRKGIAAQGWVFGRFDELEKNIAFTALSNVLTTSNESPLTKAVLDADLAEDLYFQKEDGMQQLYTFLVVKNIDPDRIEEVRQVLRRTLEEQAEGGIDHGQLHSALNHMEFATREKDFGGTPRGLIYAMDSLESWLYGGDPAQNFRFAELFRDLHKKVDEGWFDAFLRETLIDNPHTAQLLMLPSKTLGEERRAAEAARLAQVKASWDAAQVESVIREFRELRERQQEKDSEEALKSLPMLSLADIPADGGWRLNQKVFEENGCRILHQQIPSGGITYLDLYFALEDLEEWELQEVSFLASLLGDVATENYSALDLASELDGKLGRFNVRTTCFADPKVRTQATPYLMVNIAVLDSQKEDAVRLTDEVLNRSRLDDLSFIRSTLRQQRINMEQGAVMSGSSFAAMFVTAALSVRAAVHEKMQGFGMLRMLQDLDDHFETEGEAVCNRMAERCRNLFSKARLTASVTGEYDRDWIRAMTDVFSDEIPGEPLDRKPAPAINRGYGIPAEVGFVAKAANLYDAAESREEAEYAAGAGKVAGQLLTFDYLWNEIRVQGGAYGTGMSTRMSGDVVFNTYRDPSPDRSVPRIDGCGEALRAFCESGAPLEKYIISTIAAMEPVQTPRSEGLRAANYYLSNVTNEDLTRMRREILETDREQLLAFSRVLDRVCETAGVCVVGGSHVLEACGEFLEETEAVSG